MSVPVPNQTVAIAGQNGLPTPDFRRWQLAITDAVNTPAEAAPVEPVTGDYLPPSTYVRGVDGIAFYGALSTGGVLLGLETLADSGTGALLGITRDAYGRVSGTTDATITGTAGEIDVFNGDAAAGPPALSLADVTDAGGGTLQKTAFDGKGRKTGTSAATAADLPIADAGGYFTGTDVEAALQELGAGGGGGSGYAEGASFPGSPVTNDKYYRTDLNLLCYFDGARWLTVQQFEVSGLAGSGSAMPFTITTTAALRWPVRRDFDLYIERFVVETFVNPTNTGSAYWTITLESRDATNAVVATLATVSTSADSAGTWVNHGAAVGAVLGTTVREVRANLTKTGSPSGIYLPASIVYRLIVT